MRANQREFAGNKAKEAESLVNANHLLEEQRGGSARLAWPSALVRLAFSAA
jgi:hypothetical protein